MTKKCFKCGREMEFVGFDYVVGGIDENGEPDSWWIVAVYVCHNCGVFICERIEQCFDEDEAIAKIEEEYGGKWAKIPEGYVGLP